MTTTLSLGDRLPALKGEFLTGKEAALPAMAQGRIALLALGFTYDSRFAVEAWVKRFRQDYDGELRVTFYEVPMIGGLARLGKWFIDSGMRKGTPKEDHDNVMTVYGGTGPWKSRLGFNAPDDAYLILLDKDGIVRWLHNGPFQEEEYASLSSKVVSLLSEGR